ncbi:hypothetical protein [Nonomuraea pusilla]|uniref:Uncharacterized protein n=1 Tax=Nonomuraea pusilla TaxID=46177 RepID=A0A1H7S478_9ACTN|nr:hypothetical protein [Nonomuraea pusilla]SEL67420.1 hypothetical protein SAMN05660976_03045 [Nonomuraea pusilla]
MPKTPRPSPRKTPTIKANRARRRRLRLWHRLAVQKEKAERSERHAGLGRDPLPPGRPWLRRPSRR